MPPSRRITHRGHRGALRRKRIFFLTLVAVCLYGGIRVLRSHSFVPQNLGAVENHKDKAETSDVSFADFDQEYATMGT